MSEEPVSGAIWREELLAEVARLREALAESRQRGAAEAALRVREQHDLLLTLTDNATTAIFMMDDASRCTFMNPAAERMTGFALAEVEGRVLHDLIHHLHPDGRPYPMPECPIDRALPEHFDVVDHQDVFIRKNGEFFPVLVNAKPIRKEGKAVGTVIEVRDVTDAKRAAADREQLLRSEQAARAEAERQSRMKDEFLATLSHELRTPLNAILGWSQVLRQGTVSAADFRDGLAVIERNARVQTRIIEDLLDMSRIASGKVRLDVQRVDLAQVIRLAIESMQPAADAREIRIEQVLDPLAGPLRGDPARLQQVVWNLLNNAVKFTGRGGKVQVLLERVNSHVEITVSDNGQGIRPEFLPHVFDKFRQADASTTRHAGGLGLGLSIVKSLVELHGGQVRAKSPGEGRGATFIVQLPLPIAHEEESDDRRHPTTPRGESDPCDETGNRLEGVRVLVVDDEPDARELARRILEECGARVLLAGSADEAERILSETPDVDVLISDIGMPVRDGYDLMRSVRRRSAVAGGGVPAVAVTAFARSEDRRRAMQAGFDMHVAKPVEPAELLAVVGRLAQRRRQAGS